MQFLLDSGHIKVTDNKHSLLIDCIENGSFEMFLLLYTKADNMNINESLAAIAVQHNNSLVLNFFLNKCNINVNCLENSLMNNATLFGHFDMLDILLNNKDIDISYDSHKALHNAILGNHLTIVRLLLNDNRINSSEINDSLFIEAIEQNNMHVIELLFYFTEINESLAINHSELYNKYLKLFNTHKEKH